MDDSIISFEDSGGDGGAKAASDKADPFDFTAAESALNEAAKRVNAVWMSFVVLCVYFFIATYTVTPAALFRDAPVELPIFKALLPLKVYFLMAPALVFAMHAYLITLTKGLDEKITFYEAALAHAGKTLAERNALRMRLDNSVNLRALIAGHREGLQSGMDLVCAIIGYLTMNVAPVLLLLLTLLVFLPYQDELVSWCLRSLIFFDVVLCSWLLWRGTPWLLSLRSLIILSFNFIVLAIALAAAFPGEILYELKARPARDITVWAFEGPADPVDYVRRQGDRPFSNRLILPDDPKLAEISGTPTSGPSLSVRDRSFRKAVFDRSNLARVDFSAADLTEASLQGTKLDGAKFECSSDSESNTAPYRPGSFELVVLTRNERCAGLNGANFSDASIDNVSFSRASLMGANMQRVKGRIVDFSTTLLMGADFRDSQLMAANFSEAGMQGATLNNASISGANFREAYLQAATFDNGYVQAAKFNGAYLHLTSFLSAKMQGASLERARLHEASFACATFYRTNFEHADRKRSIFTAENAMECRTGWFYIGRSYNTFTPFGISSKYILNSEKYSDNKGEGWGDEYYTDKLTPLDYFGFTGWGDTAIYRNARTLEKPEKLDAKRFEALLDELQTGLSDDAKSQVSAAFDPLKPGEWSKAQDDAEKKKLRDWAEQSMTEKTQSSREKLVASRLEQIACVAEGAPYVARGLLRAGRFDPLEVYEREINRADDEKQRIEKEKERIKAINVSNLAIIERLKRASKGHEPDCLGARGLGDADFFRNSALD